MRFVRNSILVLSFTNTDINQVLALHTVHVHSVGWLYGHGYKEFDIEYHQQNWIKTLSFKLIERVLLYLSPLNRLNNSLTCRRWARIMSSSRMLRDTRLNIRNRQRRDAEHHSIVPEATKVFIRASRKYCCMRFFNGEKNLIVQTPGFRDIERHVSLLPASRIENLSFQNHCLSSIPFCGLSWEQNCLIWDSYDVSWQRRHSMKYSDTAQSWNHSSSQVTYHLLEKCGRPWLSE